MTATTHEAPANPAPAPSPPPTAAGRETMIPRSDLPRTLLALLASGLGAVPLATLFTDTGWLADVWLTMIVVVGPAAIIRRWRPASAAQVWIGLVALVPWLVVRYVHQHAIWGFIPGTKTWHDVSLLSQNLHHTTSDEVAPVHTTVAIKLVLSALLGLVAALIDLTAVVGRHGAVAGVPLLVIFTIAGAVPRKPVSWVLFVAAAAAFLILLALDSRDDLYRWGHYIPRSGSVRRRASGLISAQRIAVTAVIIAVVGPAFISADRSNLLSNLVHNGSSANVGAGFGRGDGSGVGGIDPFAALKGQLSRHSTVALFTATVHGGASATPGGKAVAPFYARQNVLSKFVGSGWVVGDESSQPDPLNEGFPSTPGINRTPSSVSFTADITIKALRSNPPVFAQPTNISGLNSGAGWDSADEVLVSANTQKNDTYSINFEQPNPSITDLEASAFTDPTLSYYLQLPSIDPYVRNLVRTIIAGHTTPYDRARALSNYFADPGNHFQYSLSVPTGDSPNLLVNFLKGRTGFCQQYAAAMAVMLRLAHVPSRVVLGYTHAAPDANQSFTVTTNDAHAWVEAYFTDIGWVPFDTTPLVGINGGAQTDLAWAPHSGNQSTSSAPTNTGVRSGPTVNRPHTTPTGTGVIATPRTTSSSTSIAPAIEGGAAVIVLGLLGTPAFARWRRRRARLRRVRHGDTDALWAELSDTATDLGYLWSDARSPRQVAEWLRGPAGSAAGSLTSLTQAVEVSRYAPTGLAAQAVDPTGRELTKDLGDVTSALGSRLSQWDRMRARIWPASLGWTNRLSGGRWNVGQLRAGRRRR